jgi:hypothetical protein
VLTCRHTTEDGEHFDFTRSRNVLVFDFGGGTCDVSILRTHADPATQRLELANLSIARYEQLGGDNIDAAIVEQVLLPQLLQQNGLESLDLTFGEKRERILPQLLGTAEALKLGFCGGKAPDVPRAIQVDLPPRPGRTLQSLTLQRPAMSQKQLDSVLEPFLDQDFLYPRDTELTPVSSVFGPIRNALKGARLEPRRRRPPARGRKLARPTSREGPHGVLPERGAPAPPGRGPDALGRQPRRGAPVVLPARLRQAAHQPHRAGEPGLPTPGRLRRAAPRGAELPFPRRRPPRAWSSRDLMRRADRRAGVLTSPRGQAPRSAARDPRAADRPAFRLDADNS